MERTMSRFLALQTPALLRWVLGGYLGLEPGEIRFAYGPNGKPRLDTRGDEDVLGFNVSHSGPLALMAFAHRRDVGVDVEFDREVSDVDGLARRCFSSRERNALMRLVPELRPAAFLRCWTRKEALMKADGGGMKLVADIEPGFNTLANSYATHLVSGKEYAYTDLVLENGVQATIALKGPSITINLKK